MCCRTHASSPTSSWRDFEIDDPPGDVHGPEDVVVHLRQQVEAALLHADRRRPTSSSRRSGTCSNRDCGGATSPDPVRRLVDRALPGRPDAASHRAAVRRMSLGELRHHAPRRSTEWNVGCEKCHGPGSVHNLDPTAARPSSIRRVSILVRANDICIQCHSQGVSRIEKPSSINGRLLRLAGRLRNRETG